MSLRKRPTVTPAMLAANRANAQKSTGPRTVEDKNGVVLHALKDGRQARNLRENLARQIQGRLRVVPVDSRLSLRTPMTG